MSETISSELRADTNISLSGTAIAALPAGLTDYTGTLSGSGTITLSDTGALAATLEFANETIVLAAGESELLDIVAGTLVAVDVTTAFKAGEPVTFPSQPLTVELPNGSFGGAGTIAYSGSLSGAGTLIVSGEGGNALYLPGGYALRLGAGDTSPVQTVTVTYANGLYTSNWNASVAANELITVDSYLSTLTLSTGVTTDSAGIRGTGTLAITSALNGGGTFEDGTFNLLIGGSDQTWDVSFGAATQVLLTNPILNDWDIDLDYNGTATLAHAGVTDYTGRIDGNGAITVSAAASGGGTLVIAGSVAGGSTPPFILALPDAGETAVITLSGDAWSVDYSAAMAAGDDIVLSAISTATLAAGTTTLSKAFAGTGALTLSAGGSATSTLAIGAETFMVSQGNSETLSVVNGKVTAIDVTSELEANDPVYLSTIPLTATLPGGTSQSTVNPEPTIDDTGSIIGNGQLIVTSEGSGVFELPGAFAITLGAGEAIHFAGASASQPGVSFQTVTITDANGVYSTDWTQSIYAGDPLDFAGDSTVTLSPGTVTDTSLTEGQGTVTLTSGAGGAGTWVSEYGTLALGAADETEVFTFANSAWGIALGSLVAGNDVIDLSNVTQTLALAAGLTTDTGTIDGNGTLTVTAAGPATLSADGQDFIFTAAGETEFLSLAGGIWNEDVTAALLANDNIVLTGKAAAELPVGTTRYTGTITGAGTLTLSGSPSGPSTLVIGGQSFVLAGAGEVLPVTLNGGVWTENITSAVDRGEAVSLTGGATLNLVSGSYADSFSGNGSIVVTNGTAASVLSANGAAALDLPNAGETATLSLTGGVWSMDVSAAVAASDNIVLLGTVAATATLGAGTLDYTGTISGTGTLVITASGYPASVIIPGAGTVALTSANPTETLTVSNGVISANVGAAIAGDQNVTLAGNTTALLASGTVDDTGTITGAGVLTLTAGTAGSSFSFDGKTIGLPGGGETVILTLANGAFEENITTAAQIGDPIILGGVPAVLALTSASITDDSLAGSGTLIIETNNSGETFFFNGGSVQVPNSFETQTAYFINGVESDLDISQALAANQDVNLNVHGSATLAAGATTFTNGGITGTNGVELVITAAQNAPSTLVVGANTFALASPGETETYTYENGGWTADASAAFDAGENIDLSVPTEVILNAGTTQDAGRFSGPDFLTLVGNSSAASTAVFGGQSFALNAGASEALAFVNGAWVPELAGAVAQQQNITLSGTEALLLSASGTNYSGSLSGTGEIIVTGASHASSVLHIAGQQLDLSAASETATLIVGNGTLTGVDITQDVLANEAIALTNLPALVELPAGLTVYAGAISGAGQIKLSAGPRGSALIAGGVTYSLAANASETVTLASVNVTSELAADQIVVLSNVTDFATLAAGLVDDSAVTGSGTLIVTASAGPSTLVLDGNTFALPVQGDVLTLALQGGVWQQNVTPEIFANQNILLEGSVVTDVNMPGSNLDYTGTLLGSGELALTNFGGADSFIDGAIFQQLPGGQGESITFQVSGGTVASVDVSQALAQDYSLRVAENATATLAPGITDYTQGNGNLVNADITLALTASASAPSTLLDGGFTFALPTAGQTEDFVFTGSAWELNATSNFAADQGFVLDTPAIVTLGAGTTAYTGSISGPAALTLVAAAAGSTAILGGETFVLAAAGAAEALSLVNGQWVESIGAALAAGTPIVLNANRVIATLPEGLTADTGTVTGTGSIVVTSSSAGPSTLAVNGQLFTFGQANETETLSLADGQWQVDVTQALLDGQVLVLNGPETVHLTASSNHDNAAITGNGSLIISSGPAGNSEIRVDNSTFILPAANETVSLTQIGTSGFWQEDITAAITANQNIDLYNSTPAVLTLSGGATTYGGAFSYNGEDTLAVTALAPGSFFFAGETLILPGAGETEVLLNNGAGAWSVDLTAALAANDPISLTGIPAQATLTGGIEAYSGALTGGGSLTLIATTASTLLFAGETFALAAGERETLIDAAGAWTANVTGLLESGAAVTLATYDSLSLPAGTLDVSGPVVGNGTLTVTSGNAGGTLLLAGQSFVLPSARETEDLLLENGVWSANITAAVAAGDAVELTGTNAEITLSGTVDDAASITGTGALTLTSGPSGGGTLVLAGGQSFVLAGANEEAIATRVNGAWTTDLSGVVAAGDPVVVASFEAATLAPGLTTLPALSGDGTLVLTAGANPSTLSAGGEFAGVPAGQSITLAVAGGHVNADITAEFAAGDAVNLGSDATAMLAAGEDNAGSISGNGELTLFGGTTAASTVALDGALYTIAQNAVLGLNFVDGTASIEGEYSTNAPIDISAAIAANQQSIVFNGGNYIIYVPAGQTLTYSGTMSGTGTLEVAGGGRLILTGESDFSLPADQQHESVVTQGSEQTYYDGINLGFDNQSVNTLEGSNASALIIDAGTEVDFIGSGSVYSPIDAANAAYNRDNFTVNGTLNVAISSGYGYAYSVGELSGDGLFEANVGFPGDTGSQIIQGANAFSGMLISSSTNFGGGFQNFSLLNSPTIDNEFVVCFSAEPASALSPGSVTVSSTIYEQGYANSVHNQGGGLVVLTGQDLYNDSGSVTSPSLSNPLLNYMTFYGNVSQRAFDTSNVQQFGNGTTANWFLPGNASTTSIDFEGGSPTVGLDYNGTVHIDTTFGGFYGPANGAVQNGNLVIIGTPGNHIIYTEPTNINGFTQIDANAILQLGDGTQGNSQTITTAYGTLGTNVTGVYSTSGGNGALVTAESPGGVATDHIIDNGELIVDNVPGAIDGVGPISLSNISGGGSLIQEGTQLLTLYENTEYTGGTTIANGTLAIAASNAANNTAGIASSTGVTLLNAGADFDISQGGNQTIQDLTGAAGTTLALGGNQLTLGTADSTVFDGVITDLGIGGGIGGSLLKQGTGTLTLGGDNTYTGGIEIAGGALLGGVNAFGTGTILNSGTLLLDQDSAGTLANALFGSGELVKQGAGNVTLAGLSRYAGAISIAQGDLTLSGTTAAVAGLVSGAGSLVLANGAEVTLQTAPTAVLAFGGGTIGQTNRLILPSQGAPLASVISLASGCLIEFAADAQDTSVRWVENAPGQYSLYGAQTNDLLIGNASFTTGYAPANFTATATSAGLVVSSGAETLCYLRGTRMLTPRGEVPIEQLSIGDAVVTRFRGVKPIKWIGRQHYALRFIQNNRNQLPVRIAKDALGTGVPMRDLSVSPGHSMLLGGRLVLAKALVNGITITQDHAPEIVDYYQIELDKHDCVFAEGCWSETYLDHPGMRAQFFNAASYYELYPNEQPNAEPEYCAQELRAAGLDPLLQPIAARAAAMVKPGQLRGFIDVIGEDGLIRGWAQDLANPELPVLLEVRLNGALLGTVLACDERDDLQRAGIGRGQCSFVYQTPGPLPRHIAHRVTVGRASDGALLAPSEALRMRWAA